MPLLTLFTLIGLVILIQLGRWQWSRFDEKSAFEGARETLVQTIEIIPTGTAPETLPLVYGLFPAGPVWRLYQPGRTSDGDLVLFLSDAYPGISASDVSPQIDPSTVTMRGRLLPADLSVPLTGRDKPEEGVLYTLAPATLLTAWNVTAPEGGSLLFAEPETVALEGVSQPVSNPYMSAGQGDDLPPERHFGYAITWWGLALALLGVYVAFHKAQGRLRFRS